MSNRERWIIYPLLLFAFLLGARDEYAPDATVRCDSVSCRFLQVQNADGKTILAMGPSEDGAGTLQIFSSHDPIALPDADAQAVEEKTARDAGHEILEIGGNSYGGYLRLFGSRSGQDIQLGHDGRLGISGLTAIDDQEEYVAESQNQETQPFWGSVISWSDRPDE